MIITGTTAFRDYNSQREKLVLPEYGRHIQNMALSLKNIADREERNTQAQVVVDVMGNLNSQLRDTEDFKHKLWDHLFILAGLDLDVDSPYPKPTSEILEFNPEKLSYPMGRITYKQYGKNIRNVINLIKTFDNQDEMLEVATDISKFMKHKSYEYNQEFPSDEVIIEDVRRFSDGIISLEDDTLNSTKIQHRTKNQSKNPAMAKQRKPLMKNRNQTHSQNFAKNNRTHFKKW